MKGLHVLIQSFTAQSVFIGAEGLRHTHTSYAEKK